MLVITLLLVPKASNPSPKAPQKAEGEKNDFTCEEYATIHTFFVLRPVPPSGGGGGYKSNLSCSCFPSLNRFILSLAASCVSHISTKASRLPLKNRVGLM